MSLTVDANNYRIDASRADDHKIRFTVKNSSGVAYDVSANTFKFTCKASLDDPIASAKFQKLSPAASGIDLTAAATGIVDVNLIPADTAALAGVYYYDLEMSEAGKIYTLRQGIFYVRKDVSDGAAPIVPINLYTMVNTLYMYGLDALWHKFEVDANGVFGETAPPQAGAPPF